MWKYTGHERPAFAEVPGPAQESVWDYPRPPRIERDARRIEVVWRDIRVASTTASIRILETASPPTFYIPPDDVDFERLTAAPGRSYCEWKGEAAYWSLIGAAERGPVAWSYANPRAAFETIREFVAFYPGRLDCRVAGERVRPQPGGFYGGWVTEELAGPFKGEPGTEHW